MPHFTEPGRLIKQPDRRRLGTASLRRHFRRSVTELEPQHQQADLNRNKDVSKPQR